MRTVYWPVLIGAFALILMIGSLMADSCQPSVQSNPVQSIVDRVTFPSADAKTTLEGYVFKPELHAGERVPAVVMMHGTDRRLFNPRQR
jgi:hypothetical protein